MEVETILYTDTKARIVWMRSAESVFEEQKRASAQAQVGAIVDEMQNEIRALIAKRVAKVFGIEGLSYISRVSQVSA